MKTFKVWVNAKGYSYRGYIEARSLAECLIIIRDTFPGHVSKTVVML